MNLNEGLIYSLTFQAEWQLYLVYALLLIFSFAAAYLLGSVNSAIVVSKLLYKEDIRSYGSGNAGLTNMLRTYGKKAALLTLIGDILKTVIAIFITAIFFGFQYSSGISISQYCYVSGLFAVIGHVFPVYYQFKGGKGVLVTASMALVLTPIPFLILISLFVLVVWLSKYVSLGSVSVAVLYPVVVNAYIKVAFDQNTPGLISLSTILLAIFIVWCHRENLRRISERTERKISFTKKEKEKIEEPEELSEKTDSSEENED